MTCEGHRRKKKHFIFLSVLILSMQPNLTLPRPFSRSQQHAVEPHKSSPDEAVIATNSDAAVSKASCVRAGYYEDEFLRHFVVVGGADASSSSSSSSSPSSTSSLLPKRPPLINRGALSFVSRHSPPPPPPPHPNPGSG